MQALRFYDNATAIAPQPHYNNQECTNCHPHKSGFPTYTTVLRDWVGKLLAFIGFKDAYAAPAPLQTYSVGGGSAAPTLNLDATVTTQTTQSSPQMVTTDVIYYYHDDHLGTPLFMSDESGKEVWRREQEPFGEDTLLRGTITENLRFPGQYWDGETGKNDNGFRTYDSKLGRYVEPDPIGQAGEIALYPYADGNPIGWIDPSGLWGIGASVSETTDVGLYFAGAGQNGAAGLGIFGNYLRNINVGGFASWGGFAGGPLGNGYGPAYPSRSECSKKNSVTGVFAGGGLNIFITNATNINQLAGPFRNYSLNLGWGFRLLSLQLAIGNNGTWMFYYGGPVGSTPTGGGGGVSFSIYNTNTWVTK